MTMSPYAQHSPRDAHLGVGRVGVRGYWFGYWFTPGVPAAMS